MAAMDAEMGEAPAPPPKRLIITQLVLENFKSYAGVQVVGPFHKCFSSVVGPNGSGKSNVIDALLFVFGKRAKQLRLNKVSELIHNSTHHRNLEYAKVAVHFVEIIDQGDEAYEVVPGSELVVARDARRNNASAYTVNGRRSSFTEVTELLKGKGIDLDNNRFLILQGEVEQIALMKPKGQGPHDTGLLEYLEDILGTDRYVPLLEAAAQKLEAESEARQGVLGRVRVAEKEREGLKGAKLAAEAYLAKEQETQAAHALIFQTYLHRNQRALDQIERSLRELGERLAHEQGKLAAYTRDLQAAEERLGAGTREAAAIQQELATQQAAFRAFERKDLKLREDLKALKARRKKLGEKLARDAAAVQKLEGDVPTEEKDAELAEREAGLTQQLQAAEAELEAFMEGLKGEVEGYRAALSAVRAELAPWEAQLAQVQSRLSVAAAERDLILRQRQEAATRLLETQEGAKAAAGQAIAKEAEMQAARAAEQEHRQAAEAARREQAAAQEAAEQAEAAAAEHRAQVALQKAEARAASSQGAVAKALLAAKASGEIEGIYGRLGDLGAVDAKYDVAASTACAALDYIVVDGAATAQKCVELVRRRQLGICTCLMLDKQAHLAGPASQRVSPPEGAARLFDLVRVADPALRPAFFHALGNTLVATDLDQATRLAYGPDKRWARVVTLQGEVINESGTLTGGGGKPRGGRIRVGKSAPRGAQGDERAAAEELAQAEAGLQAALQALAEAQRRGEAAGKAAAAAEEAAGQLETAVTKLALEAEAQRQRAGDLQGRLQALRAAQQASPEEEAAVGKLEGEISAAEAEAQGLRDSTASLQARAEEQQARIDGAGGKPLQRLRDKRAATQQGLADVEAQRAAGRAGAAAAAKQLARLRKEVAKGEKESAATAEDLAGKEAALKGLEDEALKVVEAARKAEAELAARQEALAGVKADHDQKQQEVNIIRGVELEIETKLKDLKESKGTEEGRRKQYAKRLEEARQKLRELHPDGPEPAPLTEEEMDAADLQALQYRATILEEERGRLSCDLGALEAWREKDAAYAGRLGELEAATQTRNQARDAHEALRQARLAEFLAGFQAISLRLKEMYQMITLGGDAELELVDSLDPFSEGIVFSVRPPKKSWKNIANLSGGEKTLSSLSLVFALHHYKPTPLYVMDEIDAALDFKNVSIVAHYIKERTQDAQFIIISLRNNMFELADRLVGIYKTQDATKSVAINPAAFVLPQAAPLAQAAA